MKHMKQSTTKISVRKRLFMKHLSRFTFFEFNLESDFERPKKN